MATLTKKELKSVLKECLREILKEEGMFLSEAASSGKKKNTRASSKRAVAPETVSTPAAAVPPPVQNSKLMETVNGVAEQFGVHGEEQANLMRSILADTAASTLQEQMGAGHSVGAAGSAGGMPVDVGAMPMPATPQQRAQDEAELKSLSVEGDTSRWAAVAFAGKGKN